MQNRRAKLRLSPPAFNFSWFVNKPDGQRSTVRPQASFSLDARAFLSDVEPPPLSQFNPIFLISLAEFSSRSQNSPHWQECHGYENYLGTLLRQFQQCWEVPLGSRNTTLLPNFRATYLMTLANWPCVSSIKQWLIQTTLRRLTK